MTRSSPPMRRARHLVAAGVVLLACRLERAPSPDPARAQRTVTETMDRYMTAARVVDAAGMAGFFATDGVLFEPGIFPIVTRDSIRAFMASFPGVRVDSASWSADTIEVFGGTAFLWGTYFERLSFPGQPTSEQHGRFVIEWVRQPDEAWLIRRYFRVPSPSP